jgi:SnoaL-like domain
MTKAKTPPETGTAQDTATVAATYFRAWKAKDWTTLRSVLADDATFRGPLASVDDAEACMQGLKGMSQIMTDVVIHKTFVDGPEVLTWFDLHTTVAPPAPTANWSHVENGKITTIRVTFDARPLAPPDKD